MRNDTDCRRHSVARSDFVLWTGFVLAYAAIAALTILTF
jgi:hypothetical protein